MRQRLVAALDQGTTSTRCMLFDRQGRMVSIAQREHQQFYPHPGWVEHDASEIWSIVRRIVPQALEDAGGSVVMPRRGDAGGFPVQVQFVVVDHQVPFGMTRI